MNSTSNSTHRGGPLGRLRHIYTSFAFVVANLFVLFLAVNLALVPFLFYKDSGFSRWIHRSKHTASSKGHLFNPDGSPVEGDKRSAYQVQWFDFGAYGNASEEYAAKLLDDFFNLGTNGFIYQPWVEFSEPPFKGNLLNIDVDADHRPIRRTVQPPEDPSLRTVRVFAFGGSTTFGYNVSDEHTWPSYLSKILNERAKAERLGIRVEVINYGRGYYNNSQETMLFINLLKNVKSPDLVIFMDGLNWPYPQDVSKYSREIGNGFRNLQFPSNASRWDDLDWIPIVRLAGAINRRLFATPGTEPPESTQIAEELPYDRIVDRFNKNTEIAIQLSDLYSVTPLFFTQPNATYNYSIDLYRRLPPETFMSRRKDTQPFYEKMRQRKHAIYLGDLFESWGHRKAIVDEVHYNPGFGEFLASHVAAHVDLQALSLKAEKAAAPLKGTIKKGKGATTIRSDD